MEKDYLILTRAAASRLSGEWSEDDYDVLCEGAVVGRIMKAAAAPVGQPWLWTLAYDHHEDRTPTYGYEATREAAMAAFAKSWPREQSASQLCGRLLRVGLAGFSNAPKLLGRHRSHRDGHLFIDDSAGGRHDADACVSRHNDRQNERRERRETRADL